MEGKSDAPPRDAPAPADELEEARSRVRRMREGESGGVVNKLQRVWDGFRAEAEQRHNTYQRDISEGLRRRREREDGGAAAPEASAAATLAPLPAIARPAVIADTPDLMTVLDRGIIGFNASFPLTGLLSAVAIRHVMQADRLPFGIDAVTRGCQRGVGQWIPVGLGMALYYAAEYALRPYTARFKPPAPLGGAGAAAAAAAAQAKPLVPPKPRTTNEWRQELDDPRFKESNWASKLGAAAFASTVLAVPLYAFKANGITSPAAAVGLVVTAAVGSAFVPEAEEIDFLR